MAQQSAQLAFGAGASRASEALSAVDEALDAALAGLGGESADLGLLFVTSHFEEECGAMAARLGERTGVPRMVGCTAESVVGPGVEIERQRGVAVWLACLGGVSVTPFALDRSDVEAASPDDLPLLLGVSAEDRPLLIGLADPYTTDINKLLDLLNEQSPGMRLTGGMASGATEAGQNRLVLDGEVVGEGIVGVALSGSLAVRTVVSQGCRPIGEPMVITRSERNAIFELGGKPALDQLKETFALATPRDRELLQGGLLLGRVHNEYQEAFARGDFLIRNVIGFDNERGAMAVLDRIRVGQTVQFHVRDAEAASEDLNAMLAEAARAGSYHGGLLFDCNGRGSRLWSEPGHDVAAIARRLGDLPVAGFFAAGEFGPIGGGNFIHGHTASIVLFSDA